MDQFTKERTDYDAWVTAWEEKIWVNFVEHHRCADIHKAFCVCKYSSFSLVLPDAKVTNPPACCFTESLDAYRAQGF